MMKRFCRRSRSPAFPQALRRGDRAHPKPCWKGKAEWLPEQGREPGESISAQTGSRGLVR